MRSLLVELLLVILIGIISFDIYLIINTNNKPIYHTQTLDCGNDAFTNAELFTFICQHDV